MAHESALVTRIYTRTGDDGTTATFGGGRVSKAHPRVEAYGAVDELNAMLGLALPGLQKEPELLGAVSAIQHALFALGADLATPPGPAERHITRADEAWNRPLEDQIDRWEAELAPLSTFILPAGVPAAVALHVARTVCRRAERACVAASEAGEQITPAAIAYLNRLADWLFVAARLANRRAGVDDVPWSPDAGL
jgi:cob(I)alamin adenosyltransferase